MNINTTTEFPIEEELRNVLRAANINCILCSDLSYFHIFLGDNLSFSSQGKYLIKLMKSENITVDEFMKDLLGNEVSLEFVLSLYGQSLSKSNYAQVSADFLQHNLKPINNDTLIELSNSTNYISERSYVSILKAKYNVRTKIRDFISTDGPLQTNLSITLLLTPILFVFTSIYISLEFSLLYMISVLLGVIVINLLTMLVRCWSTFSRNNISKIYQHNTYDYLYEILYHRGADSIYGIASHVTY